MFRPNVPVAGITSSLKTARRVCLYWGVYPFLVEKFSEDTPGYQKLVLDEAKSRMNLLNGDKIVLTRGDGKFFSKGNSNSVKVEIIKDAAAVDGASEDVEEISDKKKRILLEKYNTEISIAKKLHDELGNGIYKSTDNGLN